MFNSQRHDEEDIYKILGWTNKKIVNIPMCTILNHGNPSGEDGGAGQSGKKGDEIWLTSKNDTNAAYGYSFKGYLFEYEVKIPLRLAEFDEVGDQVLSKEEITRWESIRERHGLDGVLTVYKNTKTGNTVSQEIFLFNRNKIKLVHKSKF